MSFLQPCRPARSDENAHPMTITDSHIAPPATAAKAVSPVAVGSVILSLSLLAVGNGLVFAYIPVRLSAEGLAPTWAGIILTAMSSGGVLGCLLAGRLVSRVGHARAFMTCAALIVLSNTLVAAGPYPVWWVVARAAYGFAITGLFIVSQSWLNDAVDNAIRGRVMSIFYIGYIVGLGFGSLTLRFVDVLTPAALLVAIAFAAISIIPIGLTNLRPPPAPAPASIALAQAWRISPVGIAGMLAVGGLSTMVIGFAPIHASAIGYSKDDIAVLLLAMQFGTILFQLPFGWISDRTDRRIVLMASSLLVAVAGIVASQTQGVSFPVVVAIFMVWSGATESMYAISSAHANDRARQDELVTLSSSMLFAWSLSGVVVPAAATLLMGPLGTEAFMFVAVTVALLFGAFVAWRIAAQPRRPQPAASFAPMSAQAPLPSELGFGQSDTDTAKR